MAVDNKSHAIIGGVLVGLGYFLQGRKGFDAESFASDTEVGNTIYRQLGGNRFRMMAGAKDMVWDGDNKSLQMKIGRNSLGANYLIITLNANDLYDMRFESRRWNRKTYDLNIKVKGEYNGLYAEQLQSVFTEATGLYTRMAESFGAESFSSKLARYGDGKRVIHKKTQNKGVMKVTERKVMWGGNDMGIKTSYEVYYDKGTHYYTDNFTTLTRNFTPLDDEKNAETFGAESYCSCDMPKPRHVGVHPTVCRGCDMVITEDFYEDWSGGSNGQLSKALAKARASSKKPKKPLKIERLAESKELKKDSCCCGATKSNPCACMYQGVMSCSAKAPMCACYKELAEKKGAESFSAETVVDCSNFTDDMRHHDWNVVDVYSHNGGELHSFEMVCQKCGNKAVLKPEEGLIAFAHYKGANSYPTYPDFIKLSAESFGAESERVKEYMEVLPFPDGEWYKPIEIEVGEWGEYWETLYIGSQETTSYKENGALDFWVNTDDGLKEHEEREVKNYLNKWLKSIDCPKYEITWRNHDDGDGGSDVFITLNPLPAAEEKLWKSLWENKRGDKSCSHEDWDIKTMEQLNGELLLLLICLNCGKRAGTSAPLKHDDWDAESFGAESWSGDCRRCGIKSNAHTMSWFNTDLICMDCSDKEKEHPKYQEAKSMENAEVKKGNFNFQGIGLESESFDAEEVCPRCKTAVTPMLRPNGEVLMAVCDCGMIAKTPAQWRA